VDASPVKQLEIKEDDRSGQGEEAQVATKDHTEDLSRDAPATDSTNSSNSPSSAASLDTSSTQLGDGLPPGLESGIVKWYDITRGFGFIQRESGGEDVFIHQSSIPSRPGQRVPSFLSSLSSLSLDSTDKTDEQLTPLHEAVQRKGDKNVNVVKMLLARNPKSIDAKTSRGATALHLAAGAGNKEIVAQLLAHCPTLIDGETPRGNAAHLAANFAGYISTVELLLDFKPELANGIDPDNNTVLHLLCRVNWSSSNNIEKVWRLNPAAPCDQ